MSIGHVAGIDIRVHVTFLFLVALLVLGSGGRGAGQLARDGLWIAAVFASVVAHELAHALVARHQGGTVRAIILLPIGGVSQLERLPETPADELRVAAAGPLTSIGLGLTLALGASALGMEVLPVRLATGPFVARLAWANLMLGGFNLLPAFPMDGGRLLRAVLERRRDLASATRVAARVGRCLAAGMVAAGVLWHPWLSFIGVFVWFGSSAEEAATVVHFRLRGLRVADLAVPATVLDGSTPAWEAAALAAGAGRWEVLVVDGGRLVGIGSMDRLLAAPSGTACRNVVSGDAPTLRPSDLVDPYAIAALAESPSGVVAVVDEGAVVGVVRGVDVEQATHQHTQLDPE